MAQYLFVYRTSAAVSATMPSPEEIQASLKGWMDWIGKFAAMGQVVDGGDGLHPTGKVVQKTGVVSDGPFVEAKEMVGGYSIFTAENYEQAVLIAKECPALAEGGSVEIRELAGYV